MGELRYVYAVCLPFDAPVPALAGVAGAPPRRLAGEGLVAIVGDVGEEDFAESALHKRLEDLDWVSSTARAHEAVVAALMTVTSPLPLRLGTVFRDDDGVRTMLRTQKDRFLELLDRVDGRVEWGVKVYMYLPEAAPETEQKRAATGRDYLRQRSHRHTAQETQWQQAEGVSETLHAELARHAVATRLHRPQGAVLSGVRGRNVLNAAYLVDRVRSREFTKIVEKKKDETVAITGGPQGLRVELTGPWAAYSFSGDEGLRLDERREGEGGTRR
ncbi:GvpL/GvpF family gas vesicle protein [Streptomyces sp. NPDC056161]|uniref:GvpL/GvpF family gas vesicle protein n=1 Tax=Streptomyces sp. NPDC056161 TaxID=3345732 RepID=UPI0035D96D98